MKTTSKEMVLEKPLVIITFFFFLGPEMNVSHCRIYEINSSSFPQERIMNE